MVTAKALIEWLEQFPPDLPVVIAVEHISGSDGSMASQIVGATPAFYTPKNDPSDDTVWLAYDQSKASALCLWTRQG